MNEDKIDGKDGLNAFPGVHQLSLTQITSLCVTWVHFGHVYLLPWQLIIVIFLNFKEPYSFKGFVSSEHLHVLGLSEHLLSKQNYEESLRFSKVGRSIFILGGYEVALLEIESNHPKQGIVISENPGNSFSSPMQFMAIQNVSQN